MKTNNLACTKQYNNNTVVQPTSNHFWKQAMGVSILLFIFVLSAANAQTHLPPCFCCENINIYQLTPNPPPITGPNKICPCGGDIFKTIECPGAIIKWTVVTNTGAPIITFTGQSTSSITLNSFVAGTATSVTITVTIRCGKSVITNHITVPILKPDLTFNWQVTYTGTGDVWTVAAQGTGNWASYGNAWRITEVTPSNKPCNQWAYGPMCVADVASLNVSGTCTLLPGHQYRIIHWMEKCSPTWHATSGCLAVKVVCFTMTAATGKMARPAKGTKATLESVSESELEPTQEMMKGLSK